MYGRNIDIYIYTIVQKMYISAKEEKNSSIKKTKTKSKKKDGKTFSKKKKTCMRVKVFSANNKHTPNTHNNNNNNKNQKY